MSGAAPAPPSITLPRGGGAIRGIGEKFAANPVTGTGALTVPLATSPGRSGFGPALALGYDSGSGNGPFGVGWTLSLPAITRKTDKGLPCYQDEDTFILSGAEDLVPVLDECDGEWQRAPIRRRVEDRDYAVQRYRPRIEGLFARIEQWTELTSGETHWRSITPDNLTTLYGRTAESRIADPADPARVFSWLICTSYDDTGNVIDYGYAAENSDGVDLAAAHERNRTEADRTANRYVKRVRYGNREPRSDAGPSDVDRMFEVVFDYGEHEPDDPSPEPTRPWRCRQDPFSSCRAGFEVRTYRLCRRVLMFHHFPDEEGVGRDCLVRSTELAHRQDPIASFVESAIQSGYRRRPGGGYVKRSLPALEFTYSAAVIDERLHTVDAESVENLPYGLDGSSYQWVDLDGEGLSGILTEQGNAWFYKPNRGEGRFGRTRTVTATPSLPSLRGGRQQLLDLAGDGTLDLVDLDGPVPGYYERTTDKGWETLRPFRSRPDIATDDENLRFVDLTGDGHADILISGDDVLTWYPSLAEDGFGPARRTYPCADEERGPRLVFAEREQSIHLADMSGDGLADLVRIRNGEVCYWPSLGYGRFGPRVTMDRSPWFDEPDQFDPRRVRIADIDGSGTTDLLYLHRDGTRIYFNRSGNSLAPPRTLTHAFPRIDSVSQVTAVDLLGNGTACLAWSSPLPSEAGRPMRYVDLMGGQKPHLLTAMRNNLGAETRIHYAPSTRFYLADEAAGRPWVTRLPFPVHLVERVETFDRVSRNRFATRHAYHHGYFDGVEREFRGFGMVEQVDTESFAALGEDGEATNVDTASHVAPVLTRTWFHTGAFAEPGRISRLFATEYYRETDHCDAYADDLLLPDTVLPDSVRLLDRAPLSWRLSPDETRQACRVLKGSVLRQEVYALDDSEAEPRPYTVSERNYTVELLQPAAGVDHAVLFVHPRETVTATYERALYPADGGLRADPRVSHQLVLAVDDFGNVLRSASVGYGRRHPDPDPVLAPADRGRQQRMHLVATESRYTNRVEEADAYRTPQPAEARSYEVLGLLPEVRRPVSTNLFGFEELAGALAAVRDDLPHERWDADPRVLAAPARRLIEHARTRYRRDDLTGPLPSGGLESMALQFESYRLAFSASLLADLYGDRVNDAMLAETGGYVADDDGWWIPSGQVRYSPGLTDSPAAELAYARRHFFLPHRFVDPFGETTSIGYDVGDLLVRETTDPLDNRLTARNDYRVLQPSLVTDANRNRAEVAYDALGMVVGTALMGKAGERLGDSLDGFDADPDESVLAAYLADPLADPFGLLHDATTRLVYDLFAYARSRDCTDPQPAAVASLARETHVADLREGAQPRIQHGFSYSDGFGREIQKKIQAEPGPVEDGGPEIGPRWVGSGWTIFNNKGKPVRQYEPFFSATHGFEFAVTAGVSSVLFYDPVERVVATLNPNGTWEKVTFDPWKQATWDVNDTVLLDPATDANVGGLVGRYLDGVDGWQSWYAARAGGDLGPTEEEAAAKAAAHAGTPTQAWMDSLGRTFLNAAHNRVDQIDALFSTRVHLDIEGNERAIVDANGRVVMHYGYDHLSSRVRQASMEAGERLLLNDVTGKPIHSWNSRGFRFRTEYDALRRPVRSFVEGGDLDGELLHERNEYGEGHADDLRLNLRTKAFRQYDGAGVVTNEAYDFKGNLLSGSRQLAEEYKQALDWAGPVPLEDPVYASHTHYDAMSRPVLLVTPDGSVIIPGYNEANLLERLEANLRASEEVTVFVADLDYNARGQRVECRYGNGVRTDYDYDPLTSRLSSLRTLRGHERLQDLAYTYDPAGNITHIQDDAQQTIYFRNRRVEPSADYTYDAIYRLIEATGREHLGQVAGGGRGPVPTSQTDAPRVGLSHPGDGNAMGRYVERYVYDEVGNFLQMIHRGADPAHAGWTRTYHYDEPSQLEPDSISNRLTSTSDGGFGAPTAFTYDAHGNITSIPELPMMSWDHKDQLQASARQVIGDDGSPETTYYVYDAAGLRVRKLTERQAVDGQTAARKCERIYLAGFEIYREYGGEVVLERETLSVLDGRQRIALVDTRTQGEDRGPARLQRYQLANHLGSSVLELDHDSQIISYEEYGPYGSTTYQAVSAQSETPKRYRYTGQERDRESGLYYHGARYYIAWQCRWLSCDPAGLADGTNVYGYCLANPISRTDRGGMESEFCVLCNPFADDVEFAPAEAVGAVWGNAVEGSEIITNAVSEGAAAAGNWVSDKANERASQLEEAGHPWLATVARWDGIIGATIVNTVGEVGGQLLAAGPNAVLALDRGGKSIGTGAARAYMAEDASDAVLGTLEILRGLGGGAEAALTFLPGARPSSPKMPSPGQVPGRVQSRINQAEGGTRFTPKRKSGHPESAGMEHVRKGHYEGGNQQSQFSANPARVLNKRSVVKAEARPQQGGEKFLRQVDLPTAIGRTRATDGSRLTNALRVITDAAGNVMTAFPMPGWRAEFNTQISAILTGVVQNSMYPPPDKARGR